MEKYLLICLTIFLLIAESTQAQDINVTQFDFATSIENREPMGVDTTFAADIGNVFCFTRLQGAQDTTKIAHVWYYKEEEKARIELNVNSSDWRTWSSKTILENWTGPWRVLVEDNNGNVLKSKSFVIQD